MFTSPVDCPCGVRRNDSVKLVRAVLLAHQATPEEQERVKRVSGVLQSPSGLLVPAPTTYAAICPSDMAFGADEVDRKVNSWNVGC